MSDRRGASTGASSFGISGTGLVYNGLDLVLEAFAQEPDLTLHVVGPVQTEPDFVQIYKNELFHTPNIKVHGYLTPRSPESSNRSSTTASALLHRPAAKERPRLWQRSCRPDSIQSSAATRG